MPMRPNQLGQLLLLSQAGRKKEGGPMASQIPLAGANMLPQIGIPAVQQGSRLEPQRPLPLPFFPSRTRGEAATAIRPDIGSVLTGG